MKRLLAFLVTVSLVLSCLSGISLVAFAEDVDVEIIEIASADDFTNKVIPNSSKAGVLFKQTRDIEGITNDHIVAKFYGIYDGGGFSIDVNLSRETTTENFALFAELYGTVKNLTIKGTVSSKGTRTSALVGLARSGASLKNITNKATVSGVSQVGGVVAYVTTPAASATHAVEMDNLVNEGSVSGTTNVGGVIGYVVASVTSPENKVFKISNCVNKGAVSTSYASKDHCFTGGVIGQISGKGAPAIIRVENCHNEGSVTATSSAAVRSLGGVIGGTTDAKIVNCSNTGTLTGASEIGGIVGQYAMHIKDTEGTYGIESCYNAGDIVTKTSSNLNGAIIGLAWFQVETKVSDESPLAVKPLISNCFNVKTGYNANGNPIAINLLEGNRYKDNNTTYSRTMVYENCYDASGGNRVSQTNGVSLNNVFMINPASDSSGQITVTEEELQNLTKQGGAFYENPAWYVTANTNNGYLYPLLVGNKEYIVVADITPFDLEIDFANGEDYILTWSGLGTPDKYIVTINGTDVGEATEKTLDVTDDVKNKIVTVVVTAVLGDEEKSSEEYSFNGNFGGGDGTESSPYKIFNEEHFANIETDLDAYYIQEENLELKDYICKTTATAFAGHYNGSYKEIDLNLVIEESNDAVGLFGYIGASTIENLTVTGSIKWNEDRAVSSGVAAVVGCATANKPVFKNVINRADVTTYRKNNVAGIVGYCYVSSASFEQCYNYGNISGTATVTAGIVGIDRSAKYTNCGNYGDITGGDNVAGITGHDFGSKYVNCFNVGTITSTITGEDKGYAAGIVGKTNSRSYMWDKTNGRYGVPQEVPTFTNCFNAGAIIGNITVGIVAHPATSSQAQVWGAQITGCYNLATIQYPISNYTDEWATTVVNTVNAAGFCSNATGFPVIENHTEKAKVISASYYIGAESDDGIAGTTALSKDALKEQTISGFEIITTSDYKYPQALANPIDEDRDDIDVYLVTLSTDENADASINGVDTTKTLYLPNGTELVVTVTPAVGYDATVKLGTGADLKTLIKEGSVQVNVGKADLAIDVTTSALEGKFTPDFENQTEGGTTTRVFLPDETAEPIEIYSESAKADVTISRYAVIAGSAKPLAGYKVAEYGILTHTDGDKAINFNNYKYQFKGVKPADEETGFFGILLYGDDQNFEDDAKVGLITDITYYARPYVIYEDAIGNKHTAFGEMQSFTIGYDPAEAVQ